MPRGVKKENLPSKICVVCQRHYTWRKKWESCWDEVTTCSKSCNRKRRSLQQEANHRIVQAQVQDVETSAIDKGVVSYTQEVSMLSINDNLLDLSIECQNDEADINSSSCSDTSVVNDVDYVKLQRKQAKKLAKQKRRAQREGRGDPSAGQKQCDVCAKSVDLLIRCTIDQTEGWKMVCGKCWNCVSGGVVDGDTAHPYYRYGGLVSTTVVIFFTLL